MRATVSPLKHTLPHRWPMTFVNYREIIRQQYWAHAVPHFMTCRLNAIYSCTCYEHVYYLWRRKIYFQNHQLRDQFTAGYLVT